MSEYCCEYCNKSYINKNSWIQHRIRCPKNPTRIVRSLDCSKYLSDSDKLLIQESDELKVWMQYRQNIQVPVRDLLEYELDDDNKLYTRWLSKKGSAQGNHVECLLSYHDYCILVKEANLKSSDIGYYGNGYDLARYNDEGPYKLGNCRFITHKENTKERKISSKMVESFKKAQIAHKQHIHENPEKFRESIRKGVQASEKFQRRKQLSYLKQLEYEHNRDPRYSQHHNSQFGTHWITNGIENRKWHPDKEKIPEGWYLGRVHKL